MAGESAREVARRHREKIERLQRSAENWERGAEGEEATARALQELPATWTVFHDVRWPGRRRANVDHVAVGPGGVFVIDSKNWSGRVDVRNDVLRQNGRQRESAVVGAAEAALAVHSVVPVVVPQHVVGVLCFVRDEPVTGWARDVMVCSTANVVELLVTRPRVLPPHVVSEACLQLDAMLRGATTAPAPSALPAHEQIAAAFASTATVAPAGRTRVRAAQPARRRTPTNRRNKVRHPAEGVIKLAIAGIAAAVFLTSPQAVSAVSDGVAKLFVEQVVTQPETTTPAPAPAPVKKKHHRHRHARRAAANS